MQEHASTFLKRLIDVIVAATLLILLSPLFLLIACLIRVSSPGPVIYRGLRLGLDARPFRILKFRSMAIGGTVGGDLTVRDDPRVTRIGRVLRATKLDELPQLLNVLRGEMSIVGPRPESPRYITHYTEAQREILKARPGITGLSQVIYRSEEKLLGGADPEQYYIDVLLPTKLAMDLTYVQQHSLLSDAKIVLLTLIALVWPINPTLPAPTLPATKGGDASKQPHSGRAILWRLMNRMIVRRVRSYSIFVLLDVLTVTVAFEAAVELRFMETGLAHSELLVFLLPSIFVGCLYAIISYLWGLHRRLWRYASLEDGFSLIQAVVVTTAIVTGLDIVGVSTNSWGDPWYNALAQLTSAHGLTLPPLSTARALPLGVVIAGALLALLFLGCVKFAPRVALATANLPSEHPATHVLIVGAGRAGAMFASRMAAEREQNYRLVAYVDDNPAKWGRRIHGAPIVGTVSSIPHVAKRYNIDLIVIALPSAPPERISEIIDICQQTSAMIKRVPGLLEFVAQGNLRPTMRDLNVADLLGREVVPVHSDRARNVLEGRTVLVTGAAGSIGSELCKQLLDYGPSHLLALDTNETGLFDLAEALRAHPRATALVPWIADITDERAMARLFAERQPDVIFHAAAYKHVPLLEQHPYQAVRTNVLGTYTLCNLAQKAGVRRFIFISTDKAADPVNTYGASKAIGEMIVRAMSRVSHGTSRFCAVRFGNVIGSRGSVVPIFTGQIERGEALTVTDPTATRYFMTIPEACGLVIATCALADRGGLFILDMGKPVRIEELAAKMIRLHGLRVGSDIAITYTGLRPGERLHETLVAESEKLVPTSHDKIYRVETSDQASALAHETIHEWIHDLRLGLEMNDSTLLRTLMLQIVSTHPPLVAETARQIFGKGA